MVIMKLSIVCGDEKTSQILYIGESPNILEMKFISIEELKKEKTCFLKRKAPGWFLLKCLLCNPKKKCKGDVKKKKRRISLRKNLTHKSPVQLLFHPVFQLLRRGCVYIQHVSRVWPTFEDQSSNRTQLHLYYPLSFPFFFMHIVCMYNFKNLFSLREKTEN